MQVKHQTHDGYEIRTVDKFEGVRYIIIDKYDHDNNHIASGVTMETCREREIHFALKEA